jgi:hypothetical protein
MFPLLLEGAFPGNVIIYTWDYNNPDLLLAWGMGIAHGSWICICLVDWNMLLCPCSILYSEDYL